MNNAAEAKNKMQSIIKKQSIEMLKDIATKLMYNFEDGATLSFTLVMNELEDRMLDWEFQEFCDSL